MKTSINPRMQETTKLKTPKLNTNAPKNIDNIFAINLNTSIANTIDIDNSSNTNADDNVNSMAPNPIDIKNTDIANPISGNTNTGNKDIKITKESNKPKIIYP
jgi:hypothetical protein